MNQDESRNFSSSVRLQWLRQTKAAGFQTPNSAWRHRKAHRSMVIIATRG